VTNLAIGVLVIAAIGMLTMAFLWFAPGQADRRTRALVGLVPGLVGAMVVGMSSTDLVPDALEAVATPWTLVLVSAGLVVLTIRSLAR
jgi:hypothetical protein